MRTATKTIIGLIILAVIVIIILGYIGLISVPLVTSSPQEYYGSADLTDSATTLYEYVQQIRGSDETISIETLQSYGLTVHMYGTDDILSVVDGYYTIYLSDWNLEYSDSGTGWASKIWRNNLYGFGFVGVEHYLLKTRAGYNTLYLIAEGPATAWAPILTQN